MRGEFFAVDLLADEDFWHKALAPAQSGLAPTSTGPVQPPREKPKKPIRSISILDAAGEAAIIKPMRLLMSVGRSMKTDRSPERLRSEAVSPG